MGSVDNTNFVSVPEDTPVGASLCSILCSDRDSGDAGSVNLFPFLTDDSSPLSVEQNTTFWSVLLNREVKHGIDSQFSLRLLCIDNGNPRKTTVETLTFVVSRVNNAVPLFEPSGYSVTLSEDVAVGSLVTQLFASVDAEDALILYQMENTDPYNWFMLDQQTGELPNLLELLFQLRIR